MTCKISNDNCLYCVCLKELIASQNYQNQPLFVGSIKSFISPFLFTFLDFAVKVDGIHRRGHNVGLAVTSGHNSCHLVHQLHGHTWK